MDAKRAGRRDERKAGLLDAMSAAKKASWRAGRWAERSAEPRASTSAGRKAMKKAVRWDASRVVK